MGLSKILEITTLILFFVGVVILVLGAEMLVRGASRLAAANGIPPLVVGMTVVAYGTSSPELAIGIDSALSGQTDVALGNVVGSNIANILLVIGISALLAPMAVSKRLVRLDIPLMIGVTVALVILSLDHHLGRVEGLILVLAAVMFTVWSIRQGRKERRTGSDDQSSTVVGGGTKWHVIQVALVIVGLAMLIAGSQLVVDGAVWLAQALGASEIIIGLTVIAVGTSLPEIVTSIIASIRGRIDLALGNIIGSNILNILSVLGASAALSPDGVNVAAAVLNFDFPVMTVVAIVCLPIFFTDHFVSRWEGGLLLGYYVAYLVYLVLNATQHEVLPIFNAAMVLFILPLTALALVVFLAQALHSRRKGTVKPMGSDSER